MANWADLPHDLLFEIGKRVTSIESYDSFGAVCRSWREASPKGKEDLKQKTFHGPWLMLAENESGKAKEEKDMREFFSVSSGKTRKIFLPEASNQRCLSWQDWLYTVAEDKIHASLLHPVSRVQIRLPELNTFPGYYRYSLKHNLYFIEKVVLSANPSSTSDFVIMVLWGGRCQLGFWKAGDTSWTAMDDWRYGFTDIIYYDNKLYALDFRYNLVRCDVHGPNPTQLQQVCALPPPPAPFEKSYLVELSGRFLVVERYLAVLRKDYYKTRQFRVLKVNMDDGKCVEIKDLWNKALLLGYNSPIFVEGSPYNNYKPNCIYFSDDSMEKYLSREGGGKDMGIYHLSDGSIEPLIDEVVCSKVTPPTWIGPSF